MLAYMFNIKRSSLIRDKLLMVVIQWWQQLLKNTKKKKSFRSDKKNRMLTPSERSEEEEKEDALYVEISSKYNESSNISEGDSQCCNELERHLDAIVNQGKL